MRKLSWLLLLTTAASATEAPTAVIKRPADIQWKVSGTLPPSAEYTLIYEDPATRGVQLLVRFPPGYVLPAHSHGHDETILVVKGKLMIDFGGGPQTLETGAYATIPAGVSHSLKAKGACVLAVTTSGPFEVKGLPGAKD